MTVPCNVTTAEMREAFRLNLNSSLLFKLARGNFRILLYLVVFAALAITNMAKGGDIDWKKVVLMAGFAFLLALLLVVSLNRTAAKTAKELSKSNSSLTIDNQGLTEEAPNGTRTSVPWSAITRWREGLLVYTIGDPKTFRTISKQSLGEAQSGELRSLLLSQIR